MNKLMTIFAHQDDETFSAGGILARYAEIGESYAITVSSDPQREEEFHAACNFLGAKGIILPNSSIGPTNEGEIKQQLLELIRDIKPDHIITHLEFDYHHEHKYTRKIVEEVVEWASHTTSTDAAVQIQSLWAAETTILIPFPQIYIDISPYNQRRLDAIQSYESQSHKGGRGFYSEFHNTRTKLRGIQAGVDHAEAFIQIPIAQVGSFKPTKVLLNLPY